MSAAQPVRVRFAPAPSGRKHIGNYRTALFNWLFARASGGTLILRFEDTDPKKSGRQFEENIEQTLRWLGMDWDEGPFRQTDRMDHYLDASQRLESSGAVYRCWCTPEEVEEMRWRAQKEGRPPIYDRRCRFGTPPRTTGPSVLRFAVPTEGQTVFTDLVRGEVSFENTTISDLVLVRSNGTPVYQLAAVVDDTEMAVSHVLRGEDLLPATPIQILIAQALGRPDPPTYGHLPLIVGPDRAKLSTRHGPTALEDYRDAGFLAEAAVNYMAFLGWSFPDGREVFTLEEASQTFSIDRVGKTPAQFDVKKFDSVNFEWLQRISLDDLCLRATPFFEKAGFAAIDQGLLAKAMPMARERIKRLSDVPTMLGFLFSFPGYDDASWAKVMAHPQAPALLAASREVVESVEPFTVDNIGPAHNAAADRLAMKYKVAFGPTRVAITGHQVGPPLWDSMVMLGRTECLARLDAARARLAAGEV